MKRRILSPPKPRDTATFVLGVIDLLDPITDRFVFIPPITMNVNPSEVNFQYTKLINRYETRAAFIEEHWGDQLDIVTINASTGTFLGKSGLNVENRHETFSMINFQEIFSLYRNNASVYNQDGAIISQGDVTITFDNYTIFGQFQNFNWDEEADKPHNFPFNFTFEAFRTILRA